MTPTERTTAELRNRGCRYALAKDAFGFGDVLAMDGQRWAQRFQFSPGALMIQCTTSAKLEASVRKIKSECGEAAMAWLEAGNRIEVWGWESTRKRWTLHVVELRLGYGYEGKQIEHTQIQPKCKART